MTYFFCVVLGALLEVLIIFIAVRLAIKPLLPVQEKVSIYKNGMSLVDLRDLGILTTDELSDIVKIYSTREGEKKDNQEFEKYSKVLFELKDIGYFSEEVFQKKMNDLKEFFSIK